MSSNECLRKRDPGNEFGLELNQLLNQAALQSFLRTDRLEWTTILCSRNQFCPVILLCAFFTVFHPIACPFILLFLYISEIYLFEEGWLLLQAKDEKHVLGGNTSGIVFVGLHQFGSDYAGIILRIMLQSEHRA